MGNFIYRKRGRRTKVAAKQNPRLQYMWLGLDLRRELHRLLPFCPESVQLRPPALIIKHVSKEPGEVALAEWTRNRIRMVLWPRCPLAYALGTLVHEVAHFCAMPKDEDHGELFRMCMVELVRDGYGVEPAMPDGRDIYALDRSVEDAMLEWLDARDQRGLR